ncbi:MAG TPA: CHAT domain-containing protein [Allosphingosinicella sp.]|nr:CHAT domain-containing protein [Allosphingosinicella sp.]
MRPSFVVTLQEDSNGNLLGQLSKASPNFKGAIILRNLEIDLGQFPPKFDTRERAADYGRKIRAALFKHPAIGQAIDAVYMAHPQEPARLMFEIMTPTAESLRWETLCDDNDKFAAIDFACRVGRVASNSAAHDGALQTFSWPLRMVAFLSAAGISAKHELKEILATVEAISKKKLKIECTIYLGEQQLLDQLQDEIARKKRPGITALPMPDSSTKIEAILTENPPHILHFFCHGISSAGVQHLEFATINDWDLGGATGSSRLAIDRMIRLEALTHCWLTVLNCCEGAGAAEQTYSMAYQIVVFGGCPTAVGMNEPIAASDATAFSLAFYTKLFEILQAELGGAARKPTKLDFTPAIVAVRTALHELYETQPPEAFGRWSLPVLYVATKGLEVQRIQVDEEMQKEMQKRIDLVAKYLHDMPADTPDDLRDRVLAMLDQNPAVPKALRPDRFGSFDRQ